MRGGPSNSRRPGAGGHGLLVIAIAVAALGGTVAPAKDVDGVFRMFATHRSQDNLRGDAWGGTLDVRYDRQVSQLASYLFSLRYTSDKQDPTFNLTGLGTVKNTGIEPRFEIRLDTPDYELDVGARWWRRNDEASDGREARRDEVNYFGRFRTLFPKLPQFLIDYNQRDIEADLANDINNRRLLGQVSYNGGWWSASYGRRRTEIDTVGVMQKTIDEHLLQGTLNRQIERANLRVFANANVTDLQGQDVFDQQVLVPVERQVLQGLSAQDSTPRVAILSPDPALVDGNRSSPTQANIGGSTAGGQTYWNLGVELAQMEFVDVVDVWLADPIPTDSALTYRWEVYESQDNQNWTLVTGSASRQYDSADGRFRLTFSQVTAPFVKVVNATINDSLGAVFVSEIEVSGRELRQGTAQSDTRIRNLSATLAWAPRPQFSATLSGFSSDTHNETDAGDFRTTDNTGNLTLSFQPSAIFFGSFTMLGASRERTGRPDIDERSYSLTLTALPVRDLDLTVAGNIRQQTRIGQTVDIARVLLQASMLLYRDLSLSLGVGTAHEENFLIPTLDRDTLRFVFNARPRQELEFTTGLLVEDIETITQPAGIKVRNVNWDNRLTIRPSSMLGLTVQGIYLEVQQDSGWSTVFQADWAPFPGGALQFSFDARQEAPLNTPKRTVRTARMRWNLNRQMFLDFTLTRRTQERQNGVQLELDDLSAFFQARF